jgi:hypothetical protein
MHTPGPWTYVELGTEAAGVEIHARCFVEGAYRGGDNDTLSHDDAHLIAAAPDMLAALQSLERNMVNDRFVDPVKRKMYLAEIRAAIAKATK